jgi:hypothetical protein
MNNSGHPSVLPNEYIENSAALSDASAASAPASGATGKQRAGDRLNVPSSIVRAAGFVPGEKAFVVNEDPAGTVSQPCLVLLKQQPSKFLADYAVAKDLRIRVTPAMLKKCGLEGESFEIDGSDGKIVVTLGRKASAP